jgi:hypothetical protein
MKSRFTSLSGIPSVLGLCALLFTGGCYISHQAVKEYQLPGDWREALKDRTTIPEAFAGTYQNTGERWTRWMNHAGEGPRKIRGFLMPVPGDNPRAARLTVELVVVSPEQLKFIAREDSKVVGEEIRSVEWDANSRSFVYRREEAGIGRPGSQGPTVTWGSYHLYKGADGNLYEEWFRKEVGPSVYIAPVSITEGEWSQWKPAKTSNQSLQPTAPSGRG